MRPRTIKTVAIDFDGVLCDVYTPWIAQYNKQYGDFFRLDMIKSWDIHQYCKGGQCIYAVRQASTYALAKPYRGAIEAVERMGKDGLQSTVLTHDSPVLADCKIEWIDRYFPGLFLDVIVTERPKTEFKFDLLIDDALHNIEGYPGWTILMDRPWNQEVGMPRKWDDGRIGRAYDWRAVTEFIDILNGVFA